MDWCVILINAQQWCLFFVIKINNNIFILAGTIASDVEQATGLEKKEIDALMAGIEV